MKQFFLPCFFLFLPILLFCQKKEVGFFFGSAAYQGDLVFNVFSTEGAKSTAGMIFKHHYTNRASLRGSFHVGKFSGNDAYYPNDVNRKFSFETNMIDASIAWEYCFLGQNRYQNFGKFSKYFSPYFYAGMGLVYANPKVKSEGDILIDPEDYEFTKIHLMVPVGLGIKLDMSKRVSLAVEFSARTGFSDYLDGISVSGNPDKFDWYYLLGGSFSYRIGKTQFITSD